MLARMRQTRRDQRPADNMVFDSSGDVPGRDGTHVGGKPSGAE